MAANKHRIYGKKKKIAYNDKNERPRRRPPSVLTRKKALPLARRPGRLGDALGISSARKGRGISEYPRENHRASKPLAVYERQKKSEANLKTWLKYPYTPVMVNTRIRCNGQERMETILKRPTDYNGCASAHIKFANKNIDIKYHVEKTKLVTS